MPKGLINPTSVCSLKVSKLLAQGKKKRSFSPKGVKAKGLGKHTCFACIGDYYVRSFAESCRQCFDSQ